MKNTMVKGIEWTLLENGDCKSEYGVEYNVFTGDTNLHSVDEKVIEGLESNYIFYKSNQNRKGKLKMATVPVQEIVITRGEGTLEGFVGIPMQAKSWDEANKILLALSQTAPGYDTGGYDKTDFLITFEDGEQYKGRYDLKHYAVEDPDLYKHVSDHLLIHAGDLKPKHISLDQYQAFLKHEDAEMHRDFYDIYIG